MATTYSGEYYDLKVFPDTKTVTITCKWKFLPSKTASFSLDSLQKTKDFADGRFDTLLEPDPDFLWKDEIGKVRSRIGEMWHVWGSFPGCITQQEFEYYFKAYHTASEQMRAFHEQMEQVHPKKPDGSHEDLTTEEEDEWEEKENAMRATWDRLVWNLVPTQESLAELLKCLINPELHDQVPELRCILSWILRNIIFRRTEDLEKRLKPEETVKPEDKPTATVTPQITEWTDLAAAIAIAKQSTPADQWPVTRLLADLDLAVSVITSLIDNIGWCAMNEMDETTSIWDQDTENSNAQLFVQTGKCISSINGPPLFLTLDIGS